MRIFFSVGEPSGDLHAATLIGKLKRFDPRLEFGGFGGPKMASAGCQLLYPLADDPVMFFAKAIVRYPHFKRLVDRAAAAFETNRPDAVVLVDYPGFNWHIAKHAKRLGIPVVYYIPPQIWSWATWRVHKMRRTVDHVLCSLPFEAAWFRQHGIANAKYIGHPFFDDLKDRKLDRIALARLQPPEGKALVALLPGSRDSEVRRNMGTLAKAARRLQDQRPDVNFTVAAFRERHLGMIDRALQAARVDAGVVVEQTPEVMNCATAAIAVSGSVSLELMHYGVPTAIVYNVGPVFLHVIAPLLVHTPYITLVNLLAGRPVYPEFIGYRDQSKAIADRVATWLDNGPERLRIISHLNQLDNLYGKPGASCAAAESIMEVICNRPPLRLVG